MGCLNLNPKHRLACLYNRVLANEHMGNYKEIIIDCNEIIKLRPEDSQYWDRRGFAKYQLKEYEEALKDLSKAITLHSKNIKQELRFCAKIEVKLENYERAINYFDEAIKLIDEQDGNELKSQLYNNRGFAKYSLGKCEEAIEDYNEAIKLDSKALYLDNLDKAQRLQDILNKEKIKNKGYSFLSGLLVSGGFTFLSKNILNKNMKNVLLRNTILAASGITVWSGVFKFSYDYLTKKLAKQEIAKLT